MGIAEDQIKEYQENLDQHYAEENEIQFPRYCLSEICVYDNEKEKDVVLLGGFYSDLIYVIMAEFEKAIKELKAL
jgi:hypothetical protein